MDNKDSFTYQKYLLNGYLISLAALAGLGILLFLLQIALHFSGKYTWLSIILMALFLVVINFLDAYFGILSRRNYFTWGRGAGAEWVIGNELEKLPSAYKHLPDFQTVHGNIDSICIGPTGIFVIEVKSHRGRVTSSGNTILLNHRPIQEKDVLAQTKSEVHFLQKLLQKKTNQFYPVTGLLIFSNAFVAIRHPVDGVWVGGRRFCNWAIQNKPNGQLDSVTVDKLYSVLEETQTVVAG